MVNQNTAFPSRHAPKATGHKVSSTIVPSTTANAVLWESFDLPCVCKNIGGLIPEAWVRNEEDTFATKPCWPHNTSERLSSRAVAGENATYWRRRGIRNRTHPHRTLCLLTFVTLLYIRKLTNLMPARRPSSLRWWRSTHTSGESRERRLKTEANEGVLPPRIAIATAPGESIP